MIQNLAKLTFSDHISLYDILIPQDSRYRQLLSLIDFGSIRPELLKNYSRGMGRAAIDPVVLFKYLLLKTIHPASDRDLVARSHTDMAYKFFLGLNPEDDVIDPSLLTVFRRRMKSLDLMDILLRSTLDKAKALGLLSSKKMPPVPIEGRGLQGGGKDEDILNTSPLRRAQAADGVPEDRRVPAGDEEARQDRGEELRAKEPPRHGQDDILRAGEP